MATVKKPTVRGTLNRELVIEAALALVDREGLNRLSFRRLAEELGATTMAPYSHFADKEDLLEAMTTYVVGGLAERLDRDAPWQAQVEQAMVDLHDALDRHPGVVELIVSRAEGERLNDLRDVLLELTVAAGMGETEAADFLRTLVAYVLGSVVLSRSRQPIKVRRGSVNAFEAGLARIMNSIEKE